MNPANLRSSQAFALLAAGLIALGAARAAASSVAISPAERNWEVQIGQQAYASYMQRGEIVPRQSQMYSVLDPIASRIASVADREYYVPFRFILLNEGEPNAFSMPGGNVYVTTPMLSLLRNRDELAGVLCHEVNHDIHHDMYNVYEETRRGGGQPIAYERAAEMQADRSGAFTCAKAGFNPWGMVWNLRLHSGMAPQQVAGVSDHPSDGQRLASLTGLLTADRATFGKFRDDVAVATPLSNGRVFAQSGYGHAGSTAWYPTQYPSQYPAQYPSQYPAQYPSQYPAQYPPQYPAQYPPSQYPQYQYQAQYPSQYPGPNSSGPAPQMGPYPPPPPPPPPPCYPDC